MGTLEILSLDLCFFIRKEVSYYFACFKLFVFLFLQREFSLLKCYLFRERERGHEQEGQREKES